MSSANYSFSKLSTIALALATLFASGIPVVAQTATVGSVQITGVPDDWTHHHVVFSDPGTEQDAIRQGKHEQWLKIVNDPRYVIQQLRRHSPAQVRAANDIARTQEAAQAVPAVGLRALAIDELIADLLTSAESKAKKTKIVKDWSVSLGSGTAATAAGTFTGNPTANQTITVAGTALTAKVSAQATGSITIASTFCVGAGQGVTIGGVGLTTNATVGSGALTVAVNPSSTITVGVGSTAYSIQTGSPGTTANRVRIGTNAAGTAENLTSAINASGSCNNGTPCFGSSTAANSLVSASWTSGSSTVSLTGKCGGTSTVALTPDGTDIKVLTAWAPGTNGTTGGTNFALNGTSGAPTNADVATQVAAAINANSSTGVTAAAPSNAVSLTAITGGTAGNSIGLTTTIGTGATLVAMNSGANGTNTGTSFAVDFNTTDNATNLAAAIARIAAVSASRSSGAVVTVTAATAGTAGNSIGISEGLNNFAWNGSPTPTTLSGGSTATVQPNAYPAKYGVSLTSASCSDFAIYPTGGVGGSGAATIIAYDNLYSGSGTGTCTSGNPTVYWAYNTATGYSVTTSPTISLDGTQVAFIESNGTTASLVLIKWAAETGETVSSPLNLTDQASASAYNSCTPTAAAPCMYTIQFANGQDDTFSAPFVDYRGDAIYVGDDGGNLHQFTGVFLGAPAENMSSPWPVPLGTNKLASPVYDATWDAVFVGDLGGGLYCVTSTPGSCQSGQTSLGAGSGWYKSSTTISGGQIADAPLINSGANYLLAFVNSGTSDTIYGHSEQFFPSTSPGTVGVGAGANGYYLYAGNYDNVYYDSPNNTGNLYVVGNTGATTGAILYRVGLSGGFLNGTAPGVVTGLTLSGAHPWPSPVSEFCNNGASSCALQTATGCTVSASTTITCASGGFSSADVNATINGTDIPVGTTISSVTTSTKIVISATATGNPGTVTIGVTNAGKDYVFFSVNQGTTGGCTSSAGNGCILSYNVSNPNSVVISASTSGLPVVTPTGSGCWASGGLSIDNSATTTGASQIYFIGLNGAAAGSSGNGPTSSNCTSGAAPTISATQDSQSNP